MENMEQTLKNIEMAYESVQQEIGVRITETVGRDLEGLIEAMASMPMWTERCFDKETAELVRAWEKLTSTAGELAVMDDEEDEMPLTEDSFFQAGVDAREAMKERARQGWKGQQKVVQMNPQTDPYSHPDEEFNF